MKRYGRLQAVYLSFFSGDLYRDVARNWTGIGLLYLLLLLAAAWLPTALRTFTGVKAFAEEKGTALAQQMPTVTIKDGEMRATPGGRHEVTDPSTGRVFLIIDDTIDEVPAVSGTDVVVITRKEFGTFQTRRNERRVWKLAPGVAFEVTAAQVREFLAGMPYWAAPMLYVFALVGSLAFRTVQVLVYGNIGMFFARRAKAPIDYTAAVRIAAVAVTPVIVVRTLIWFMPTEPAWYIRWPVAFVVTVLLIRLGVRAAAQAEPPATVPV
jgi:hypothetical protein